MSLQVIDFFNVYKVQMFVIMFTYSQSFWKKKVCDHVEKMNNFWKFVYIVTFGVFKMSLEHISDHDATKTTDRRSNDCYHESFLGLIQVGAFWMFLSSEFNWNFR